jgi:hypothetical protein
MCLFLLWTLGAVFRTPLATIANALGVQCAANDVIANARQILYPATSDEDD